MPKVGQVPLHPQIPTDDHSFASQCYIQILWPIAFENQNHNNFLNKLHTTQTISFTYLTSKRMHISKIKSILKRIIDNFPRNWINCLLAWLFCCLSVLFTLVISYKCIIITMKVYINDEKKSKHVRSLYKRRLHIKKINRTCRGKTDDYGGEKKKKVNINKTPQNVFCVYFMYRMWNFN